VAVDERRVVGEQDHLLRARAGAEHIEHLCIGERHVEERVGIDVARDVAICRRDPDDDDRAARPAQELDRLGQRAIRQPARQDRGARCQLYEARLQLGDRGHRGDRVAERLERAACQCREHRFVGDHDDVHA